MSRFDSHLFRCSALGYIMNADETLTQSIKTHLLEVFIGEIYQVRKEITSKYFEKGKFMEEDGITLLNETLYKGKLLIKNKERRSNDFIHGECDCIAPDKIIYDIKNAYDKFTFGKADCGHNYKWQLKGYLWLWGLKNARLFYCLNNMPEHLLCDEERKLFYQNKFFDYENPEYQKLCVELREKHNYDNMALEERFKIWNVSLSVEDEKMIEKKVIMCRKYLNNLWDEHAAHIIKNRSLMGLEPHILIATHSEGLTLIEPENILLKLKKITT